MVRQRKDVDWAGLLRVEDFALIGQRIDPDAWYPMASFERLGLAILAHSKAGGLDGVRLWGIFSANRFVKDHPTLIAANDPVETMMRLNVMRASMFDFSAFALPTVTEGHAVITLAYQMSALAEEAACWQTVGFCEGVLTLAGARGAQSNFVERSWSGAARTTVTMDWRT
jgi:hypothetical protein